MQDSLPCPLKKNKVFLLCARVDWCDVCTDFTNVIKVDYVNNSDAEARLKRQKSPETTNGYTGYELALLILREKCLY